MIWSGMEQTHLLYRFAVDMERVRERSRIDQTIFLWRTWELERAGLGFVGDNFIGTCYCCPNLVFVLAVML